MNSSERDINNELGEVKQKRKVGRKSKKQSEKEIMNEYYSEFEKDCKKNQSTKRVYENMQYLSASEKANFENKFTKPININQENYVRTLCDKYRKIVIASGPAGTGKTLFATEHGIKYFLTGVYEKIIFTRPSVSVDEDLGYLPGTLEEKMAPWIRPIFDVLYNFISAKEVAYLMEEKYIEIAPLGYMRGRTFKNCWIVADEMQNSTISQMKMLMTRLGENSRLVITGDLEQFDRVGEINGLDDFLNKLRGRRSDSISSFEFNKMDIQREEVVREVLDIYSSVDVPPNYLSSTTETNSDDNYDSCDNSENSDNSEHLE